MRLISWNANGVHHKKRSFEQNAEFLWEQPADLIIISETNGPIDPAKSGTDWNSRVRLGLGVAVRGALTLSAPSKFASPIFSSAYTVTAGRVRIQLVAAWPVRAKNAKGALSYGAQLLAGLTDEVHGKILRHDHAILCGDFNSTAKSPRQAKRHNEFVDRASALGLRSVYHEVRQVAHGQEKEGDHTYRHGGPGKGQFHIDYCFLSPALLRSASFRILNGPEWEELSDHYPIQVDFTVPDSLPES